MTLVDDVDRARATHDRGEERCVGAERGRGGQRTGHERDAPNRPAAWWIRLRERRARDRLVRRHGVDLDAERPDGADHLVRVRDGAARARRRRLPTAGRASGEARGTAPWAPACAGGRRSRAVARRSPRRSPRPGRRPAPPIVRRIRSSCRRPTRPWCRRRASRAGGGRRRRGAGRARTRSRRAEAPRRSSAVPAALHARGAAAGGHRARSSGPRPRRPRPRRSPREGAGGARKARVATRRPCRRGPRPRGPDRRTAGPGTAGPRRPSRPPRGTRPRCSPTRRRTRCRRGG